MKNSLKRTMSSRDVVIAYEDSDDFHNAELIDHTSQSICFLSATPFQTGKRIYIMTTSKQIDDFDDKFTEAYFAEVVWCKKFNLQYAIGAEIEKFDLLDTYRCSCVKDVAEH